MSAEAAENFLQMVKANPLMRYTPMLGMLTPKIASAAYLDDKG